MNPAAQFIPFFLAVIAVGLGVIYSNSRIADIKNLTKSEVNGLRGELGGVRNQISSFRNELGRVEASIRGDIARLDQRVERLERGRVVRP